MNVMLVDADTENIKNFRTYIRNAFSDMRIVGSLSDANKDIAAAIRDLNPQLIIADIKFFGGVRFMRFKEIHDAFPDMRFIVYGTYNESDYMKRAKEFGAIDFMYRPVKPADLSRCLNLAAEHFKRTETIKQEKQILTQNYHERLFQYEEIFLRGLVEGHIQQENEIKNAFDYFNIPFDKGFTVAILRVDHFKQVALALSEMEKHMLAFQMLRVAQDFLVDYKAQAFIMSFNAIVVIVGGYYSIEDKVLLFDNMKHAIHERANARVTIGIGRTHDEVYDIAISYKEADAAFRYRYRMGYNAVIPIEFAEPDSPISYRYPSDREERLVYTAVVGDYEYCHQLLSELFNALAQSGSIPDGLISKIVMNIVIRISRCINEQNLPIGNQVTHYFPTGEMLNLHHLDDGFTFLDNALKNFCAFVGNFNEQASNQLHEAARLYVRDHYPENFSVARIAISLNTTPENLNRVFMEKEHMMLFDFVMWVRVYEAQELLKEKEPELDEETIAAKVGFDDVKYFRSVFKKYNGETPAEFRVRATANG